MEGGALLEGGVLLEYIWYVLSEPSARSQRTKSARTREGGSYVAQISPQNACSGSTCLHQILSKSVQSLKNGDRNTDQKVNYKNGGGGFIFSPSVFL